MSTTDEALISLITELVGTVALYDMEKAKRLGKRVQQALAVPVQEPTDVWFEKCFRSDPPAPAPVPTSWMEMVTANLVREGVNKHKARELAEHFYRLTPAAQQAVPEGWKLVPVELTNEMLAVCDEDVGSKIIDGPAFAVAVWMSFLAAAPEKGQP